MAEDRRAVEAAQEASAAFTELISGLGVSLLLPFLEWHGAVLKSYQRVLKDQQRVLGDPILTEVTNRYASVLAKSLLEAYLEFSSSRSERLERLAKAQSALLDDYLAILQKLRESLEQPTRSA
jgi:diketogulonate reductase-like aldo/keto reductase